MPLFLLLLILVLAAGALIWKGGRASRWILGVVAFILVVLGGVFFMFNLMPRERSRAIREFDKNYQYQVNKTVSETPAIWFAGMEDKFEADVYPSQLAAVRGLGHRLEEIIQQQLGGSAESTVAQLVRDEESWRLLNSLRKDFMEKIDIERWGGQVDEIIRIVQKSLARQSEPVTIKLVQEGHERQLLEELRRTLRDKIDRGRCLIVSDMEEVNIKAGEIGVSLNLDFVLDAAEDALDDTYEENTSADERGVVEAVVLTGEEEYTISVPFVEKPWVENFASFMNSNPDHQWLVARSSETCSTAEKAHELGLQDAVQRISYILSGAAAERLGRGKLTTYEIKVGPQDIHQLDIIVDKFPQSFRGSTGPIWREALLIDVSAPKLDQLSQKYTAARAAQRRSGAYIVFSFVGMIGLICLLYALVNAATKGYYSTILRVLTTVLVVGAALAGLLLILNVA